jgi:chromate reductase
VITIVSGTNRPENVTLRVALLVRELLTAMNIESQVLDLQKLPRDFAYKNDVFGNADPGFSAIVQQFVLNADRFVFVVPEYNGSFPGVCKTFIDAVWPESFQGKKAAIIGLSSGRSGNLRGLDHLTSVLHYLEVIVFPKKVTIPHVEQKLDDDGNLIDEKIVGHLNHLLSAASTF